MAVADILMAPAKIYKAPVGETLPAEDSIAYGTAWGGNWTDLGYTLAPITVAYSQDQTQLEVEQLTLPVGGIITMEKCQIETTLGEINAANIAIAFGGSVTTQGASTAHVAKEELVSGGSGALSFFAWGIEGLYTTAAGVQLPVRMFIYKGQAVLNGNLNWSKKEPVGIPLQITAYADTSKSAGAMMWKFQKVTAAKS